MSFGFLAESVGTSVKKLIENRDGCLLQPWGPGASPWKELWGWRSRWIGGFLEKVLKHTPKKGPAHGGLYKGQEKPAKQPFLLCGSCLVGFLVGFLGNSAGYFWSCWCISFLFSDFFSDFGTFLLFFLGCLRFSCFALHEDFRKAGSWSRVADCWDQEAWADTMSRGFGAVGGIGGFGFDMIF